MKSDACCGVLASFWQAPSGVGRTATGYSAKYSRQATQGLAQNARFESNSAQITGNRLDFHGCQLGGNRAHDGIFVSPFALIELAQLAHQITHVLAGYAWQFVCAGTLLAVAACTGGNPRPLVAVVINVFAYSGKVRVKCTVGFGRFAAEVLAQRHHLVRLKVCGNVIHGALAPSALEVFQLPADVHGTLACQPRVNGAGTFSVGTVANLANRVDYSDRTLFIGCLHLDCGHHDQ